MARARQAAVLVGGKGTRLGEATRHVPKPLLPIEGEKPFIELLLDNVVRQGFDRILLLAGHFGEQFAARYDGRAYRTAQVSVVVEEEPAGTGGALARAAALLEDTFLVFNGDSIFDFVLRDLERALAADPRAQAAMALRRVPDCARYGSVDLRDGRITRFAEKQALSEPRPGLINGGVYLMRKAVIDALPSGFVSLETDVFPTLAASGQMLGLERDGYFLDIGLPETLARGRGELAGVFRRPALFLDRDGVINLDHGYVHAWEQFEFVDGIRALIRHFNARGWFVFVVTNQAGVAHGLYEEAAIHALHDRIQDALAEDGAFIDGLYFCTHHPDAVVAEHRMNNPPRRKPNPGMILDAMAEWPVDRARSVLIGDRPSDVEAARAAGIRGHLFGGGDVYRFASDEGLL